MGTIYPSGRANDNALRDSDYSVGPVAGEGGGISLATSQDVITGLSPGDMVQVFATDSFHCLFAPAGGATATTASPGPFPRGLYRWACPDGCAKVAMIQATGATATGGAFKG